MRDHKALLSSTGLVLTFLISGCQTLAPTRDLATTQTAPPPTQTHKPSLSPSLKRLTETIQVEESAQDAADDAARRSLESLESELSQANQDDLWERMRQGYRLDPSEHPKITRELRRYRKQVKYIDLIQERARPYLHFILNELEQRDMPMEIALLPAIESAYQPFAYSPGRAMGLWQFIPSTGRSFGLKQNYWFDGRRDVVASTRAALDYLKQLNEMFDGDWELALAAYNSGAGTVQRAVRRNQSKGRPTDYWSLKLPKETSRYVPCLLALSRIFADPERYGVSLQKLPDEPYFQAVDVDSQLDLQLAARLAGLSVEELRLLNPGYKRLFTPPDGPHQLLLPLGKTQGFLTQLAELPQEKRLRWTRYKIKKGDNLSTIARHYHVSVRELKEVNKLQSNTILAGHHLVIPRLANQAMGAARISNATLVSSVDLAAESKPSKISYEVQKGDSLYGIAERFSVTIPELKKWNALPGEFLLPGQLLKLYVTTEQQTL
ncbi:MAG: transglycosylase SLT domain-containing protein [Chromatiales bacterium]|jgi:membrane-bound lytic murein transglycosylase D